MYADFGNPSLYPTVGRLVFVESSSCAIKTQLDSQSIAVVDLANDTSCMYSDLFYSVQQQGGIAGILIMPKGFEKGIMQPSSDYIASQITIPCIAIDHLMGNTLTSHSDKEIWVSYSYDLMPNSLPLVAFLLTGDYDTDKSFFQNLQGLVSQVTIPPYTLDLGFIYGDEESTGVTCAEDCVTTQAQNTYCAPSTAFATGVQILTSTAISLNFYYYGLQSPQAVNIITEYFLDLYGNCTQNLSLACQAEVLAAHGGSLNDSLSILDMVDMEGSDIFIRLMVINDVLFFWEEYLAQGYCLSMTQPSAGCPGCSQSCQFSDLAAETCNTGCNSSACGYQNMQCLQQNGCYGFMLGDGNCNEKCSNDPDCHGEKHRILVIVIPIVVIIAIM